MHHKKCKVARNHIIWKGNLQARTSYPVTVSPGSGNIPDYVNADFLAEIRAGGTLKKSKTNKSQLGKVSDIHKIVILILTGTIKTYIYNSKALSAVYLTILITELPFI